MVEKYGKGEMNTQKCKTCSYEQVIHSAGVHVSENGAVKVYAEEDFFWCPNCVDPFEILNEHQKGMFQYVLSHTLRSGTHGCICFTTLGFRN